MGGLRRQADPGVGPGARDKPGHHSGVTGPPPLEDRAQSLTRVWNRAVSREPLALSTCGSVSGPRCLQGQSGDRRQAESSGALHTVHRVGPRSCGLPTCLSGTIVMPAQGAQRVDGQTQGGLEGHRGPGRCSLLCP